MRDSKRLNAKQREEWFRFFADCPDITWAVARVWPNVIDRINIARAADRGALRVYRKLSRRSGYRCETLLDAGLALSSRIPYQAIVKGDEKIPAIAAASIIAKVIRDRIMLRLHRKYPQYRFDLHKGYGTKLHRELLRRYGYSDIHRKSFRVT